MTIPWKKFLSWFALALGTTASAQEKVHIYSLHLFEETTLDDFQKVTGIKPVYDTFGSDFGSDKTSEKPPYDLLVGNLRDEPASRFQKLDKSLLPNWKNLDPQLLKRLESIDPGNQYLVPLLWKTSGIGYNPDKVKAALGIDKIDSWNVLFEPENIEKLSQCGVALLDSPYEMIPLMLAYLGFNPNSTRLDDYKKAEEKFIQISKHVTFPAPSRYISALAKGNICMAAGFSSHMMLAADQARTDGNGIKVHYAIPKEGAALQFDFMAIPLDAGNAKAAHAFINYLLDPQVITRVSNDSIGYANPNLAARELINKDVLKNSGIYPPQAALDKTYVPIDPPRNITHEMMDSWKRIKSAK